MPTGEIFSLQSETCIGVIHQAEGGEDLIFHAAALVGGTFDRLSKGQAVEYDMQPYRSSPNRSRAINVRILEAIPPAPSFVPPQTAAQPKLSGV